MKKFSLESVLKPHTSSTEGVFIQMNKISKRLLTLVQDERIVEGRIVNSTSSGGYLSPGLLGCWRMEDLMAGPQLEITDQGDEKTC